MSLPLLIALVGETDLPTNIASRRGSRCGRLYPFCDEIDVQCKTPSLPEQEKNVLANKLARPCVPPAEKRHGLASAFKDSHRKHSLYPEMHSAPRNSHFFFSSATDHDTVFFFFSGVFCATDHEAAWERGAPRPKLHCLCSSWWYQEKPAQASLSKLRALRSTNRERYYETDTEQDGFCWSFFFFLLATRTHGLYPGVRMFLNDFPSLKFRLTAMAST